MDKTGEDTVTCNSNQPTNMTNVNEEIDIDNSSKTDEFLTNNALLLFTLLGVIVGFSLGFGLRQYNLSDSSLMWLGKGVAFNFMGVGAEICISGIEIVFLALNSILLFVPSAIFC